MLAEGVRRENVVDAEAVREGPGEGGLAWKKAGKEGGGTMCAGWGKKNLGIRDDGAIKRE